MVPFGRKGIGYHIVRDRVCRDVLNAVYPDVLKIVYYDVQNTVYYANILNFNNLYISTQSNFQFGLPTMLLTTQGYRENPRIGDSNCK